MVPVDWCLPMEGGEWIKKRKRNQVPYQKLWHNKKNQGCSGQEADVGKKTILLVDDEAVVKDVIRISLEQKYVILEASTYSEVMNLSWKRMDLAIVDYNLRDGDGFEVSERLRTFKPNLPIIFITGYSTEDLAIKALRAGVTEYIKKPMDIRYLSARVSAILHERICKECLEDVESGDNFIMDGIAAYIENHYNKELNRDSLAKLMRIDKYKLSKTFNVRFGNSIPAYLNDIRIRKGAELLRGSELTISEVAEHVGYRSLLHFERVFKTAYGISPTEYRGYNRKPSGIVANGPRL